MSRATLADLNTLPAEDAVLSFGGFFENSPWIVKRALTRRPFDSLRAFHEACMSVVRESPEEERLKLIRAHPDLVGRLAREGRLTAESTAEQKAAGLDTLSEKEISAFEEYNARYHRRFDFPFVICARENRKDAILAAFPERLKNTRAREMETAVEEIGKIAWLRMSDAISDRTEEE